MRKSSITLVLSLALTMVFCGFTATEVLAAKDKVIVLKFSTSAKSEGAVGSAAQQAFKNELEKLTNGKVKVELYYGWALSRSTEAVIGGLQTSGFQMSD